MFRHSGSLFKVKREVGTQCTNTEDLYKGQREGGRQ